jgi:asparagine synthetase B (glutamine-hydrolysing)
MCGICGQFNFGDRSPLVPHDVERMTKTLMHRGPDDEGYFVSGPLGLGFRRLSIIDLGGGHQPMSDAEKSVWVIFNGEIYNFRELRQDLEGPGTPLPNQVGYRSDRSRLQAVGNRRLRSAQRHVRRRHLERAGFTTS